MKLKCFFGPCAGREIDVTEPRPYYEFEGALYVQMTFYLGRSFFSVLIPCDMSPTIGDVVAEAISAYGPNQNLSRKIEWLENRLKTTEKVLEEEKIKNCALQDLVVAIGGLVK